MLPQVNIIPVIAKADTISKSELHKFKIKIMSELVSNGVQIYQFPIDDETVAKVNTSMNVSETFCLILDALSKNCCDIIKHMTDFKVIEAIVSCFRGICHSL